MELQLALDFIAADQGMAVAKSVGDLVDVVELGTPFVLTNPIGVIREFKTALPGARILADYKIMDAGELIAAMAYDAGADIATVSARTWDDTIAGALKAARERSGLLLADLMGVPDAEIARRAKEVEALGVDYVCVHRAIAVKGTSSPEESLKRVRDAVSRAKVAVAGGIDIETLRKTVVHKPDLVIVGSAITSAKNPRQTVQAMREIMEGKK